MNLYQEWEIETCVSCSQQFAFPAAVAAQFQRNHKSFYCPHCRKGQYYPEKSDTEKLSAELKHCRRVIEEKKVAVDDAKYRAECLANSNRALKGHVTRNKNKLDEVAA